MDPCLQVNIILVIYKSRNYSIYEEESVWLWMFILEVDTIKSFKWKPKK